MNWEPFERQLRVPVERGGPWRVLGLRLLGAVVLVLLAALLVGLIGVAMVDDFLKSVQQSLPH